MSDSLPRSDGLAVAAGYSLGRGVLVGCWYPVASRSARESGACCWPVCKVSPTFGESDGCRGPPFGRLGATTVGGKGALEVEEDRVPQQVGRGSPHHDGRWGGCHAVKDDRVADGVRGADERSTHRRRCDVVAAGQGVQKVTHPGAMLSASCWQRSSSIRSRSLPLTSWTSTMSAGGTALHDVDPKTRSRARRCFQALPPPANPFTFIVEMVMLSAVLAAVE